jgi:hypothetical protein
MRQERATASRDLLPSESRFIVAMQRLGYGRFEFLRIHRGELVLDPWPTMVRKLKFGTAGLIGPKERPAEFELKQQLAELFEYVRDVESGEIRALEVKSGLPFSMQIDHRPAPASGCGGA